MPKLVPKYDPLLDKMIVTDLDSDGAVKYDPLLEAIRIKDTANGMMYDPLMNKFRQGTLLNQFFGTERDNTISSKDRTRIASSASAMSLHKTLPIVDLFKPCVENADGTVNYYLNPIDLTKKLDGTASDLTGAAGNVMSRQTAPYWKKYEKVGNIERTLFSMRKRTDIGWFEVPVQSYSIYEGKILNNKLMSVSGQLPTASRSETQFRIDARVNGAGWQQQWYAPYRDLVDLYQLIFATNDFQKPVDYTLTAEGYCKGGLGNGVTTAISAEWNLFNAYNPFIQGGSCNQLQKHWGETNVVVPNFGGAGVNRTFTPNRFLFVENIFGHIWKWVDGVTINHLADRSEAYIFDNPAQFVDNSSLNGRLAGLLPIAEGWMKTALFPDILPASVGGSSTTQYCDYFYRPAVNSGWKALLSGGTAANGSLAGAFYATASTAASFTHAYIGARLCRRT